MGQIGRVLRLIGGMVCTFAVGELALERCLVCQRQLFNGRIAQDLDGRRHGADFIRPFRKGNCMCIVAGCKTANIGGKREDWRDAAPFEDQQPEPENQQCDAGHCRGDRGVKNGLAVCDLLLVFQIGRGGFDQTVDGLFLCLEGIAQMVECGGGCSVVALLESRDRLLVHHRPEGSARGADIFGDQLANIRRDIRTGPEGIACVEILLQSCNPAEIPFQHVGVDRGFGRVEIGFHHEHGWWQDIGDQVLCRHDLKIGRAFNPDFMQRVAHGGDHGEKGRGQGCCEDQKASGNSQVHRVNPPICGRSLLTPRQR